MDIDKDPSLRNPQEEPIQLQRATPEEIADTVSRWTASPEGQEAIMEGQQKAWKAVLALRKARRIKDLDSLRKPRAPQRRIVFQRG